MSNYTLNFRVLLRFSEMFRDGALMTLKICILSLIIGFVLGTILAVMKQSTSRISRIISSVWVDFLRNTPFLVQLFFFYYGLPELGIDIQPTTVAIVALGINSSAPNCEVIRAGLMAVKSAYREASLALGFSKLSTLWHIVLPIALRLAFKPLTSNFVNLFLTSSVTYGITVMETRGIAKTVSARTNRPFEIYFVLLVLYCGFTYLASFTSKLIDKKISIKL